MRSGTCAPTTRRVRFTLLALLWAFAATVFLVVDLFLNVSAFDEIRPRATLYRSVRYVGHSMVGEPYLEADEFAMLDAEDWRRPVTPPPADLAAGLAAVRKLTEPRVLRAWATGCADVRVRGASLERLVLLEGAAARPVLTVIARDRCEPMKLRVAAARLVGRTGPDALAAVEEILEGEPSPAVRAGAAAGLIGIETAEARARFDAILRGPCPQLKAAAAGALAREHSPGGHAIAVDLVRDPAVDVSERVALCWMLCGASAETAIPALSSVAGDEAAPAEVRRAATVALRAIRSKSGS